MGSYVSKIYSEMTLQHPTAWHLIHPNNFLYSCQPDNRPDIHPNCTEEKLYQSLCADVILSDRFKPCHALVPPEAFLDNCIYDMCEYDGMQATLCNNVEAYAEACKSADVTISWRNATFCRKLQCLSLIT